MEQQSSEARTHLMCRRSEAGLTVGASVLMQAAGLAYGSVHTIAASSGEHQHARACPQEQGRLISQWRLVTLKPRALVTA